MDVLASANWGDWRLLPIAVMNVEMELGFSRGANDFNLSIIPTEIYQLLYPRFFASNAQDYLQTPLPPVERQSSVSMPLLAPGFGYPSYPTKSAVVYGPFAGEDIYSNDAQQFAAMSAPSYTQQAHSEFFQAVEDGMSHPHPTNSAVISGPFTGGDVYSKDAQLFAAMSEPSYTQQAPSEFLQAVEDGTSLPAFFPDCIPQSGQQELYTTSEASQGLRGDHFSLEMQNSQDYGASAVYPGTQAHSDQTMVERQPTLEDLFAGYIDDSQLHSGALADMPDLANTTITPIFQHGYQAPGMENVPLALSMAGPSSAVAPSSGTKRNRNSEHDVSYIEDVETKRTRIV